MTLAFWILCTLLVLLVLWCYSLYFAYLAWRATRAADVHVDNGATSEDVFFHVIIPCFNEQEHILSKLENTARLAYPERLLSVTVVDGGSDDDTAKLCSDYCADRANFAFVESPDKGKIAQINHVLPGIDDGVVLVTDVDGELSPDLLRLFSSGYADERVGCLGAYVTPADSLSEDAMFWRHQNAMRLLESRSGHSSVLIAVAYSFRRELFDRFPDDVIADDVYVAFESNTQGYRSYYGEHATALEVRSGSTSREMLKHKLRKINANMKELLRFAPRVGQMNNLWRVMFLTKFFQTWIIAPLLISLVSLAVLSLVWIGIPALFYWGGAFLAAVLCQHWSNTILSGVPPTEPQASVPAARKINYLLVLHAVLVLGFFRYFVTKQSSVYRKVN